MTEITLEEVMEFIAMLTGKRLPDCWEPSDIQPKLTPRQAFTIVYYLQEFLGVLPDHYEQCGVCEELYDSECGGFSVDPDELPDDWHTEIGVTSEMIEKSGGAMVCSMECEVAFWREKFPDWTVAG